MIGRRFREQEGSLEVLRACWLRPATPRLLPGVGALSSNPPRRQARLRLLKPEGGLASPCTPPALRPESYSDTKPKGRFGKIRPLLPTFDFSFFFFFFPVVSRMRCGPRRGGALLPKTQAAPFPRRGRQTLAITQFSRVRSALCFGIARQNLITVCTRKG